MENSTTEPFNTANSNAMLGDVFLIPMTDFVLKYYSDDTRDELQILDLMNNYANFLKQPLKLEMFVPCDEDENILEEPRMIERNIGFDEKDVFWDVDEVENYKKAKEKVLFEGFYLKDNKFITDNFHDVYFKNSFGKFQKHCLMDTNIEYIVYWKLKLSQSALNAIFGKTIA